MSNGDRSTAAPVSPASAPGSERRSAGGVVIRRVAGRVEVLVGEQRDWNSGADTVRLPKGHLDPGESDEQAALREVREETGREARILAALPAVSYRYTVARDGSQVDKTVAYFLMEDLRPSVQPRDEEMKAVRWVAAEDAAAQLSFETEQRVVRDALARLDASDTGG